MIGLVQVSAKGYSQITLNAQRASLSSVLKSIKEQTGYVFITGDIDLSRQHVDVNVSNVSIEKALEACLKNTPLAYKIVEKTVVIKAMEATVLSQAKPASNLNMILVHGRIMDETGQPISGATITVKGSANSTISDAQGYFTLKNVDQKALIVVSFLGYQKKELNAAEELGEIKLEVAFSQLDQVQIIAYGQTTERLSTSNVATVSSKTIENQPVSNPLLALQGRVPGLLIKQASGLAGGGVSVQIHGQNSISRGTTPLYVVDGVPYAIDVITPNNAVQQGGGININNGQNMPPRPPASPLAFINPQDIESISVLKDADAISIYGSRAANGAILITTKKGKAGKTAAVFNFQHGLGVVANRLDLMNTEQYLAMRNEAMKNTGLPDVVVQNALMPSQYDINGTWDQSRYTDWQEVLIGGTAKYTNLQASISGGDTNTQFIAGGGYHRETTVFPTSHYDEKASVHFSLTNTSMNKRFKFQLTGSYQYDYNDLPTTDFTALAMTLPPNAPEIYNSDGTINWAPLADGSSTWDNPLAAIQGKSLLKTQNLISNSVLSYQIAKGLVLKSSFGYTLHQLDETRTTPATVVPPQYRSLVPRSSVFGNHSTNSWIIEPQLNYDKVIGKGKLGAIIGGTFQRNNRFGNTINASGYPSDELLFGLTGATVTASTNQSIYRYNAMFGRVNYNWDNKYILNLTARRDGSSRFGSENKFHNFWSVGSAWIFSEEKLIQEILPVLSHGKLSGSYGITGNDQIPNYLYLANYVNVPNVGVNYQGIPGFRANNLSNPYIQWESTNKFRIGLDLGFLKDRILFNSNYFLNRSSNQLLDYALPVFVGFSGITQNFPATIQNSGWEFSLNTINMKSNTFKWTSSANLTIPENKLIAFPNLETSSYANRLIIGQPVNIIKTSAFAGVNPTTGVYQYIGADGQLKPNPSNPADLTKIIDINPKFYGGFQNNFSYKDFELDIFFQFVNQLGNNASYRFGNLPGLIVNQPVSILSAWQQEGDNTQVQQVGMKNLNPFAAATLSDEAFMDASFVRLKNASLSWQLPGVMAQKVGVSNARIYINGQNLLTFTRFKGLDPETQSFQAVMPPLKVITLGVKVGL
ncbi:SusC/RagA family TonB-linked outer membrane protein [Sphingobacterium lumbrici]|uniref:SusC/RagA family TonB-linked outer membrane protein n=1 Tax=Sphingobacterium lumbrici TaxID=2559600 RepID=UPI0015E34F33|nr:SusC/RagA family TonB-linked outer membrane protein [Sphingobacterium lumbrici]